VPKAVPAKAEERGLTYVDATCPLVSKVHRQAERLVDRGATSCSSAMPAIPEVVGTFGQVPEGQMTLVETARMPSVSLRPSRIVWPS
jgi:4-hydroxy-3-methylbut-2-enyl diphosphate reductase